MFTVFLLAAICAGALSLAACTVRDNAPKEKETYRFELTVTDEEGNFIADAEVTAEGVNGMTDAEGKVTLESIAVRDTTFTINADGYISETCTVTEEEIIAADYAVKRTVELLGQASAEPGDPEEVSEYLPRSENYLAFSVGFGADKALIAGRPPKHIGAIIRGMDAAGIAPTAQCVFRKTAHSVKTIMIFQISRRN